MDLFTVYAKMGLDASKYEYGIKNVIKSAEYAVKATEKIIGTTESVSNVMTKAGETISKTAETSLKSYRQLQSDVGKLAWTYQQAGMSQSEAMKKANAELRATGQYETFIRKNADALKDVADEAEDAAEEVGKLGDESKKTGKEIANAAEKPKKSWLSFGETIGKAGKQFDWATAKAVAFGNMAAAAIRKAVNVATNFGKSAIQNAADVAAEKAQFTATFAELQGSAEKTFKEIEKSTGVYSERLKVVGTKAFSQFKGAGLDGVDALDMMKEYTNLAADAAAYFDITLEDADVRLRSFLRGNTEAGDAIGLFTTESQRNSAALEKYGQKWQALTEAQKQMLMLDVTRSIYEQSGVIGQAGREAASWTNVIGNLGKAWQIASAALGEPILAVISPVVQDVYEWLKDEDNQTKITQFGLTIANAMNWVLHPTVPTWEEVKEGAQTTFDAISEGLKTAVNWTLGKLGMPDVETVLEDVENWWGGQGNNAYERIKSVLSWSFGEWIAPAEEEYIPAVQSWWNDTFMPNLTSIAQWTFGQLVAPAWADLMFSIKEWWDNSIKPRIKRITTWDVGKAQWPSPSEMYASAKAWWKSVKSTISSIFTVVISPQYSYNHHFSQNDIDSAMEKYSDQVDAITSASKRAVGIDYVPFNDFAARLHEGEAVLTKAEATDWRRGGSGQSGSNADLLAELRALRQELAASRKVFTPDGRVLGDMVTEPVSQNIAAGSRSRRYSFG